METLVLIGIILFVPAMLAIRYLVKKGIDRTFDAASNAMRKNKAEKGEMSESENLADRYETNQNAGTEKIESSK